MDGENEHWVTDILDVSESDRKSLKISGEISKCITESFIDGVPSADARNAKKFSKRSHFSFINGFSSFGNSSDAYVYQLEWVEMLDSTD